MNLILDTNSIKYETDKALLIKLPNSGLSFWHPKKLCSTDCKGSCQLNIWMPDNKWRIKAQRNSKKTREVLETWTGTAKEAVGKFNLQVAVNERLIPKTEVLDELLDK